MHSSIECAVGFGLNSTMYLIIKLDKNGIGECGVRQFAKGRWNNLSIIDLSNMEIIKVAIKLEMLAVSG